MNQSVDPSQILTTQPTLLSCSHTQLEIDFQALHAAYQNAETWAKRVENIIDDVPIAAINQMRYAGYHISKVLSKSQFFPSDNPQHSLINIDDLRSAYKHLLRAYFDSLDQLTQQLEAQLKDYENKFQDLNIVVTDHFPDFFDWLDSVTTIAQFDISNSTESVNQFSISKNDRENHYQKIVDKIDELEQIQKKFRAIANCLIVQANKINTENSKWSFSKNTIIIGIVFAILGASGTCYFGYKSTLQNPKADPIQPINKLISPQK